ncbi:MAG TPA: hypothetical protein VHV30_00125 [Polyangiaceae bacterium]|jgi:hypothetical protein|nr:hypothetical protein [Polyangiaceae bacterium]
MRSKHVWLGRAAVLGGWLLAACSSSSSGSPANVAGDYSVNVTDANNGCDLQDWTQGSSATNIPLQITQSGSSAQATVTGLTGTYLQTVIGTNAFSGPVAGETATLTAAGTRSFTVAGCTFTVNMTAALAFSGDTVQGTNTYSANTNHSPDCGAIETCTSVQNLSGSRPPDGG